MRTNYHTHTTRCMHATGSDESYVLSAIKYGYSELGFSDHSPWQYASRYVSGIRMAVDELPEYVRNIRYLQEKYNDQISIKAGLECEYFEDYIPWLKETIEKEKLDYIIFGNHFYKTDEEFPYFGSNTQTRYMLRLYEESSIKGMESGLYACFAHPDLFTRSYFTFDEYCEKVSRSICRRAKELDMLLEYNLSGFLICKNRDIPGYPHPRFWEIAAEEGCKAIIGVDAHSNSQLKDTAGYDEAARYLKKLHIEVVQSIPFLR